MPRRQRTASVSLLAGESKGVVVQNGREYLGDHLPLRLSETDLPLDNTRIQRSAQRDRALGSTSVLGREALHPLRGWDHGSPQALRPSARGLWQPRTPTPAGGAGSRAGPRCRPLSPAGSARLRSGLGPFHAPPCV